MPPDMAIDMRRTKLKAEEAALLAGELMKPSWQSKNEGIHERVSFEDAIWGFDLAGGSYYKTPLRVVGVKSGSRAEKAGIRPGDKLKRINDIDTSTLTIQEAHEIIIASGIHLKIAVSAPEDEEDAYFCYEDPIEEVGCDSDEERRRQEELARKRQVHARVRSDWSLQWPWVSKRRIIYRESNCFMVPSKYESKHRDKFPVQPTVRTTDDGFVRQTAGKITEPTTETDKTETNQPLTNGHNETPISNGVNESSYYINDESAVDGNSNQDNKVENNTDTTKMDIDEQSIEMENSKIEGSENHSQDFDHSTNDNEETTEDITQSEEIDESPEEVYVNDKADDIINEVYETTDSLSKDDEEHVLNSILSEEHETEDER